ncbi:unnamed protein product [Vicia faba]|uniref:Uncharacterized protein n=1 Tax=Vicia faba TaxID=3906 RepID=A0AAV0ZBA8_VICFA|nr:unnamed protein product [Vicia faba]
MTFSLILIICNLCIIFCGPLSETLMQLLVLMSTVVELTLLVGLWLILKAGLTLTISSIFLLMVPDSLGPIREIIPFFIERRLDMCTGNQLWFDACNQISVSTIFKVRI